MAYSIIKETIELPNLTTDANGVAFVTKRINLKEGQRKVLTQVDMFQDRFPTFPVSASQSAEFELVITAYPAVPTNMDFAPGSPNSYAAAGDDSILFKAHRQVYDFARVQSFQVGQYEQFPSVQIAAQNASYFYTDHVFINLAWRGDPDTTYNNIAYSLMLVVVDKNVSSIEHSLGVLSEQHDAMCAQVMSNGRMQSRDTLDGNVFPMWRYGGTRPEHTISPTAANTYFLDIASRDAESMVDTAQVRQVVADARQMQAFDAALGLRRPDWLREFLNGGIEAGAIRPNPVPLRRADNGNTRMF